MSGHFRCSVCELQGPKFRCIMCEAFFCEYCNTFYHDEKCLTKQRSNEWNLIRNKLDITERWIESSDFFSNFHRNHFPDYDDHSIAPNGLEINLTETSEISRKQNMSEKGSSRKKMSKRAPVPCPKLPSSFRDNEHHDHGNYSYASIEFRPVIITEDGAVTTSVDGAPGNFETEDAGSDINSNNEEYHWEDEIATYNEFETEQYREIETVPRNGHLHSQNGNIRERPIPQLHTDSRTNQTSNDSHCRESGIYEAPIDPSGVDDIDVSQLYAVVDFSKKKKKSQKKYIDEDTKRTENANAIEPSLPVQMDVYQKADQQKATTEMGHSKVGKSKFFVDIPDQRSGAPPPIPKPYAGQRKKSAPALLVHNLPPLPPRTRDALVSSGKNSHSSEDIANTFASISESSVRTPIKGHRRNLSGDLHYRRKDSPVDLEAESGDYSTVNFTNKKSFEKKHRRMKSHETITTVFSPSPKGSKTDLTNIENYEKSPLSGKSSSASSTGDSPVVSKDTQSQGENYQDDMTDLMRKAEALISDELPEGWQEVRDGNEVYYWHIWTGTIQYERPVLSTTPSSSSQSVSPSFSDTNSSQSPSVNDQQDVATQSKSPETRLESPHEKPRQAISFPVHSMGWVDVEEEKMSSNVLAETVNDCISSLAEQRKDLWGISETWGEGKDIKLILEGESLKLLEPKSKSLLLVQPIAKMRVWGVGKEDQRDFAFIARDPKTNKHKCHMFRCHGNVSGRSIANALHTICNRVLEEKRRAKEKNAKAQKAASDLLNAPLSSTARGNSAFNEKPYYEQKKCFSAKYIGWTEVSKSSGIDTLNKAVNKLTVSREPNEWKTVLVEITTSEIKTIDCSTQAVLMEDRVRFISFLGVAKDERMCGYIVAAGMETFVCHVFCCIPHAGTLTRAIEEACKLRYEKFLYRGSEEGSGQSSADKNAQMTYQRTSVKEKSSALKNSMQGLFSKLQKRDSKKKDDSSHASHDRKNLMLQPGANEYLVKYFGCVQVELGTGMETIQGSVDELSGGAMMIGYLEVTADGLTLCDSQRTALSRRVIDLDTISYCGITSDQKHFGIIVSQGRGKYACHVCQEYKTAVEQIVSAIHEML